MASESSTGGLTGSLSARVLRSAFRAHAESCQQAHVLLDRCNRTYWSQSAGDQLSGAVCIDVNVSSGLVGCAWAGQPALLRLATEGHDWLGGPQLAIGMEPESCYARQQIRLHPGDALVILGEPIERALVESGRAGNRIDLATMLWDHRHTSAVELTELVRAFLDSHDIDPETEDRSLLAIKRQA
jgi:serine phosphatase RsbU (regulator of sigma subunit)